MNPSTTRRNRARLRAGFFSLLLVMGLVACSLSPSPDLPSVTNDSEFADDGGRIDIAQGTGGGVGASAVPTMGGAGGMGGETTP